MISHPAWTCGVFHPTLQETFFSGEGGDAHDLGNKLWVKHPRQHVLKYKDGVSLIQQLWVGCISVIGVYT